MGASSKSKTGERKTTTTCYTQRSTTYKHYHLHATHSVISARVLGQTEPSRVLQENHNLTTSLQYISRLRGAVVL